MRIFARLKRCNVYPLNRTLDGVLTIRQHHRLPRGEETLLAVPLPVDTLKTQIAPYSSCVASTLDAENSFNFDYEYFPKNKERRSHYPDYWPCS